MPKNHVKFKNRCKYVIALDEVSIHNIYILYMCVSENKCNSNLRYDKRSWTHSETKILFQYTKQYIYYSIFIKNTKIMCYYNMLSAIENKFVTCSI